MAESHWNLLTRRLTLAGLLALPAFGARAAIPAEDRLDALEKSTGGRIGVAAIDMGGGDVVLYRENERFLMASTSKLLVVAAMLARIDAGQENPDRVIHYTQADLLSSSLAASRNVATGMSVIALCEAAISVSDNTAASLLLAAVGGPEGLNRFLASLGDKSTHLDRTEPALNTPDGDKDTTTPSAMLGTVRTVLLGDGLSAASRQRLTAWLEASITGKNRLRAGLPSGWAVGDKTGTGKNTLGDLAIVTPPGRKPILVVSYVRDGNGGEAVFAEIGRIVADAFA